MVIVHNLSFACHSIYMRLLLPPQVKSAKEGLIHRAAATAIVYRGVRRARRRRGLSGVARRPFHAHTQHTAAGTKTGTVQLRGCGTRVLDRLVSLVGQQRRGGGFKLLSSGLQKVLQYEAVVTRAAGAFVDQ